MSLSKFPFLKSVRSLPLYESNTAPPISTDFRPLETTGEKAKLRPTLPDRTLQDDTKRFFSSKCFSLKNFSSSVFLSRILCSATPSSVSDKSGVSSSRVLIIESLRLSWVNVRSTVAVRRSSFEDGRVSGESKAAK
uniref:Uncharacterized protein n=1 Tax=Cacopsylla melanoneura TaxID=428564 RepID=A0A8D8Z3R5_9HEMI